MELIKRYITDLRNLTKNQHGEGIGTVTKTLKIIVLREQFSALY